MSKLNFNGVVQAAAEACCIHVVVSSNAYFSALLMYSIAFSR